jgi:3-oxoacyl-[acyl-carrier-protein] synthase-3
MHLTKMLRTKKIPKGRPERMTRRAVVTGVGHYLPERVVPNSEFEATLDTTDEWIRARSGIERRHFAAEGETTSDLAANAARAALADAGVSAEDVDAIVLATSTADLTFPSAATMVQAAIGMTRGFAFDVQAVCAGFVYALSNASALIASGQADKVLVIGAETFSRIMDWTDRSTCVLFGDGAGALLLEAQTGEGTTDDRGILATDLNSDGRYKDLLYVDGGVSTQSTGYLRMQGNQVFRHAIEKLARTAETSLERAGLTNDDVDWIVPHQANIRIIQGTAKKMNLPMENVVVTVQDHGNTSAASIPLALSVGKQRGQIKPGDLIVTEAIGGGLAWGAVVLRW